MLVPGWSTLGELHRGTEGDTALRDADSIYRVVNLLYHDAHAMCDLWSAGLTPRSCVDGISSRDTTSTARVNHRRTPPPASSPDKQGCFRTESCRDSFPRFRASIRAASNTVRLPRKVSTTVVEPFQTCQHPRKIRREWTSQETSPHGCICLSGSCRDSCLGRPLRAAIALGFTT
jgi:hypothetical protein